MPRLALGTAQFGFDYGISNIFGRVKNSEISSILKLAKKNNINLLDTAKAYGNSEDVIGNLKKDNFIITTKLAAIPKNCKDIESYVQKSVSDSLQKLKVRNLYGILLHEPSDLFGDKGPELINSLNQLKFYKKVKKIGVSIYEFNQLEKIINLFKIDIVQAPLNLMDRRLERSGWLEKLCNLGIEVHVRSIFLQGLLLMPQKKLPKNFEKLKYKFDKWYLKLQNKKKKALNVCLSYPLSLPNIKYIILGVENTTHLEEIISNLNNNDIDQEDWLFMETNDEKLINPNYWSKI